MPLEHRAPGGPRPQDPFVHTFPPEQSASAVQVALQAAVPHLYGTHDIEAGVTQLPTPSQAAPGMKLAVPVGQVAALHGVPAAYFWQPPPSHLPLLPQVGAPWLMQVLVMSGEPAGRLVQVPRELASAHDLHKPSQGDEQQTPWAQMLERHSVLLLHVAPGFFLPHELPLQMVGGTQF
jgi:hypothetical protein